jgi:REP element-mobilizing transposase RayT
MESLLPEFRRRFLDIYGPNHNIPYFKWQKSFRDHIIRDDNDFSNHLDYVFNNALKHGLVKESEEWTWMWVESMENSE